MTSKPAQLTFGKVLQKWLYHTFDQLVPHERNNHHPHLLKHRALVGYSVILVLLKVLVIIAPIALPSSSLFSSAITIDNIISLTNQTRINLGLPELENNDLLDLAARQKAEDMAINSYFAHTSPSGVTPWEWFNKAGYVYQYAGENLAVNFVTAEGVSDGWMASPTHRANIVNTNFQEIGVGVAQGEFQGFSTTFVVQLFGTPKTNAVTVAAVLPGEPEAATQAEPVAVEPITEPDPVQVIEPVPTVTEPEPVIVGTPYELPIVEEVVPEPMVITPVVKPVVPEVVIDTQNFALIRDGVFYKVKVPVANAKTVAVHLADESVNLANTTNGIWSGTIHFDPTTLNKHGDVLTVLAVGSDGNVVTKQLAWVAPDVSTQNIYNFNESNGKFATFFGVFTVHNLQDSVAQFYLYFMVALVAALLINIFVKIRIQHTGVIAHASAVIALAFVLWMV